MRKIYFLIVFFSFISFHSYSQSTFCGNASPFCAGGASFTFPSVTGFPNQGTQSCVFTTPNPSWFYIQSGVGGNLNFTISQTSTANGGIIDVDFILWGAFNSPTCAASDLSSTNMMNCSYSVSGVENFYFNAEANKYYMLLITNFSEQAGQISITQTNFGQPGAGSTTCDIVCPLAVYGGGIFCQGSMVTLFASIPNATSYQWSSSATGPISGNTQSITVSEPATYTVVVNKPGCMPNITASATYVLDSPPILGTPNALTICSPSTVFNLTQNTPVIANGDTSLMIDYHTTLISAIDAGAGANLIINPSAYVGTNGQTIYVSIETNSACIYTTSFQLNVVPSEVPVLSYNLVNQTITITAVGNGNYQYSLDNGSFQISNVFNNVDLGSHSIQVISTNGCGSAIIEVEVVTISPPSAVSPQYFNAGGTLQNLITSGQNVQWYATASNKNGIQQTMSLPLPLSTPLVDGTIYHASQTINGIESFSRTPVLALLSSLSGDAFSFSNFNYFPNPVKNSFTITNSSIMDSIEIVSILGQKIMAKKVNALQIEIDLSSVSKGIYFLKVGCEGHEKIVKICKE